MYRKYVDQLEPQSARDQQATNTGNSEMSDEDQWRKQWNAKPVEELWAALQKGKSSSLLKKHLTEDRYKKLKDKKTSLGGTLAQCISSGKCFFPYFYLLLCSIFIVSVFDLVVK